MPQKTNLNISPYYDDFDKADNFYKVLFKPGHPVQARELTGLQSILQNQVESFGSHIFKEGSMVIPGNVDYDPTYFSSKINSEHLGIDVSVYLNAIISNNGGKGTRVRGQSSQIVATIKNYILPPEEGVDDPTIFVKYNQSGTDGESAEFPNGEILVLEENVTYGNTTLLSGETVLTLVPENASNLGSAFGVNDGVYFIRGTFVDVTKSVLVLDPYSNKPSYRVGFEISEQIINANDDPSLYDNAKGFTNYAAPGADRFKLSVKLSKKALDDFNDTNFVELFRVKNGETKKLQSSSVYSHIEKWIADRTYDESGSYAVRPFTVNVQNSLNDEIRTNGLFTESQKTDENNDPSEDLMCIKLSPGRAYVRGYDVDLPGGKVLDVEKPRDTKTERASSVSFKMGSLLKVNNVQGSPFLSIGGASSGSNINVIGLYNQRKGSSNAASGIKIGEARVYQFGMSDAPYENAASSWDLYLWDIQTYTTLKISAYVATDVPVGARVRGLGSGAIGYIAATPNTGEISLSQTSGSFIEGEGLIINEVETKSNVIKVNAYTSDDIRSVFQAIPSGSGLVSAFSADSVLYDRILPNFQASDQLNVTATTAKSPKRRFSGQVGIKTDSLIAYQRGDKDDEVINRIIDISGDGATLTLATTQPVAGVNDGSVLAAGISTTSTFRIKSPRIIGLSDSGLYSRMPRSNVSTVDTSNSNLIISRQIRGKASTASPAQLELTSGDGLDISAGISSAYFEPFDAERYSITYANGLAETLTSDQVSITNGGNNIKFTGLSQASANLTVNVTMKKLGLTSKSKDYIRSQQVEITRSTGAKTLTGLTTSTSYGVRVEDDEICLNVPDVANVHAIYEAKDSSKAVLDKLTFVSGLALNTTAIVGEKILGTSSRAIGQIVSRTATDIEFVYLNANRFEVGETAKFKESNVEANIQVITPGNYTDKTRNYKLDKGHREQYCDYSRIVRKTNSTPPSKRLLVIYDQYKLAAGDTGDVFTANSYTKDRYTYDIPAVGRYRATDILDFRPRVSVFDPSAGANASRSPFSFNARSFEETNPYVPTPDESSVLGFSYYLPRIDKLVINKFEEVKLIKGVSSEIPAPPMEVGDSMVVAEIEFPPYLYDTVRQPNIRLYDNRRFTMRDIGNLEKRIINLETFTTLSALELETKSLQVKDADGLDRFKSGFVVNNFKNRDFVDFKREDGSRCDVDVANSQLISAVDFWSLRAEVALDPGIDPDSADLNSNLKLLDPNCQKTGDLITLKYTQVASEIKNLQATQVENVNPFNVIVFVGACVLDPPSDNWVRTIYVDDYRTESSGAEWAQIANVINQNSSTSTDVDTTETEIWADHRFEGNHTLVTNVTTTTTTTQTETEFVNTLTGPSHEFDYVESVKVSGETDTYMRSRNVAFAANGLKPFTKHYHYLDSGQPDVFPKLTEIEMSSGTFKVFEDARIELAGTQVGLVRVQKPNHKFGDTSRPDVGAGLGAPNVLVEEFDVDPFDRDRPAPSSTYSATSKIFNCDTNALANLEKYYGYVMKGAKIVGQESGAVATVTSTDLWSDSWGDCMGAFYFRNPNATPQPPVLFFTGTKTFRITAAGEGALPLPGSTVLASDASGTYSGTGTILTQETSTVGVRNPPPPAARPNEFTTTTAVTGIDIDEEFIRAPYRDPLAQTFTVDESGMFLTSVDVWFGSKDPNAKCFVELRTVELGTPTNRLVQDYGQVTLHPNNINIYNPIADPGQDFHAAATKITFPSPIYLEPQKEYALVFLSPGSDLFEMWCATMGQKTVQSSDLPDVQNVVASQPYISGSLFKSQNGTIWTPSQYQDLTFQLYKAEFVPSGTATFYNSSIEPGNENTQNLSHNPIRTLPRKLKVPVSGLSATVAPVGRKISTGAVGATDDSSIIGVVEAQGANWLNNATDATASYEVISAGEGYDFTNNNNLPLKSLTGSGSGVTVTVSLSGGAISVSSIVITSGSGYQLGEILTIDDDTTTNAKYKRGTGFKIAVKKLAPTLTHLYLTDVQGEQFASGEALVHYNTNNDTRTDAGATVASNSTVNGDLYTGNVIEVIQPNHAHHAVNNKVSITGVEPDTLIVKTTSALTVDGTVVSVGNTTPFTSFAGISTDRGDALLEEEIVNYVVNVGELTLTRGRVGSSALPYPSGVNIQPYEANGIPLVGINTTFNVPSNTTLRSNSNIDNYYLEVDRASIDHNGTRTTGKAQMSFISEKGIGGSEVSISQNHQFSTLSPKFNIATPGSKTRASAQVRTVSGTSAGGNEVSFIDQGFEPTILNQTTFFPTPRMAASKVNEVERLTTLPRNKSIALKVDMTSGDKNLSPILDVKNMMFELGRNKINNPIGVDNYATDTKTTGLSNDPHGSIFISKRVDLKQPATSLKVLLGASIEAQADIRVYYRLFTADSTGVDQVYRAFPGYKNLRDTDGDGFGDEIINLANNDGRPDAFVDKNIRGEFSEYQFSVDDLEQFSGFVIKVVMTSTNECAPVKIKDFRAIALA